eukprot:m.11131 g.11131  ORF g.11131 m.11131 type:complete len:330 (-) comp2818_c0_seq1:2188-3177(-)
MILSFEIQRVLPPPLQTHKHTPLSPPNTASLSCQHIAALVLPHLSNHARERLDLLANLLNRCRCLVNRLLYQSLPGLDGFHRVAVDRLSSLRSQQRQLLLQINNQINLLLNFSLGLRLESIALLNFHGHVLTRMQAVVRVGDVVNVKHRAAFRLGLVPPKRQLVAHAQGWVVRTFIKIKGAWIHPGGCACLRVLKVESSRGFILLFPPWLFKWSLLQRQVLIALPDKVAIDRFCPRVERLIRHPQESFLCLGLLLKLVGFRHLCFHLDFLEPSSPVLSQCFVLHGKTPCVGRHLLSHFLRRLKHVPYHTLLSSRGRAEFQIRLTRHVAS